MTISKKQDKNFGIILRDGVGAVPGESGPAVQREHWAKAAAAGPRSELRGHHQTSVRFQMMQNRLYLSNYLLSGDTREAWTT